MQYCVILLCANNQRGGCFVDYNYMNICCVIYTTLGCLIILSITLNGQCRSVRRVTIKADNITTSVACPSSCLLHSYPNNVKLLMDAAAGWMCDTCNYYSIINYQCDNSAQLCCVLCWYCGLWLWLRNPIIRSQNVQCDWIWKYQIPAPVVQCICCLPLGSTIARGLFTSKMKIDSDSLTLYAVVSLSLCGVELVGCQEAVPAYERWCKQIAHTHTHVTPHCNQTRTQKKQTG